MTRTTHVNVEIIERDESENQSQLVRTEKLYNLTPNDAAVYLLDNGAFWNWVMIAAIRRHLKYGVSIDFERKLRDIEKILEDETSKLGEDYHEPDLGAARLEHPKP